jgi:hypothetical protein
VPSIRPTIGVVIILIGALLALAAARTPTEPAATGHARPAPAAQR